MFSIWIGSRPGSKELECMAANNEKYGLTLIASQNWIGSKNFKPIEPLIKTAICNPIVKKLWEAFPEPNYRSDALRLWYLLENPFEIYVDSDCIVHSIPTLNNKPLFPSIQSLMEKISARFGAIPDMDDIKNSSGQWLDVWMIVGAGNSAFFSDWLELWVESFFRPGGISEALSNGPFKVDVIPTSCFTHFSERKAIFKRSES